jgi:hypothetical protein
MRGIIITIFVIFLYFRHWRIFVKSRKTTFALAQAYDALGINEKSVKNMPFEKLAMSMESPVVLRSTKALLDRLEKRLVISHSVASSSVENVDHLLKRLGSPPRRKAPPSREGKTRAVVKRPAKSSEASIKLPRYSLRVVLCAYMILAHPSAVLSGQGEREKQLIESAANFIKEFELLIKVILDGPGQSSGVTGQRKFRAQLANFDKAWCSYLYSFVVWKVKDARLLEEDLVRAACKLELSMMQTCKLTADRHSQNNLTHDMKAIQKQVIDDQKLLRDKVQHLSGDAGLERMNSALSDTRSKFFEAKENGSPLTAPVANVSTPLSINSSGKAPLSEVPESSRTNVIGTSSVMPAAGQVPALVPVLRSGHGAPVGQPSPSAGDTYGQPECKGEKLDKLIRIGLLQLISSVEGLQLQSTPESFQINLLRLRAVQSQFQQVIVIATR